MRVCVCVCVRVGWYCLCSCNSPRNIPFPVVRVMNLLTCQHSTGEFLIVNMQLLIQWVGVLKVSSNRN